MRRSNETRIYGPYKHGDVWRNHHVVRGSDGKRKTLYDVYPTRELAEGALRGSRQAQGVTVRQAINAYVERIRARGREGSTIASAEDRLWLILGLPANGERSIRWVNSRGVELYLAAQDGRAVDTHQNALALGKSWGKYCVQQGWLRTNPFENVEAVGQKTVGADKPQLNVDESRKLLTWCRRNPKDIGGVLTFAYVLLGVRASELVKRNVRDLDDSGRLLRIGKTKTKSGRRQLMVPDELRLMLLRLAKGREPDAPLFVREDGERMSRFTARLHVRRVTKAAGVPMLSPQALRRTQASLATEAGATGLQVAAHLGHATGEAPTVTKRHYVNRDAAQAAKTERALRVISGGKR